LAEKLNKYLQNHSTNVNQQQAFADSPMHLQQGTKIPVKHWVELLDV
jgi:hypothetical protein